MYRCVTCLLLTRFFSASLRCFARALPATDSTSAENSDASSLFFQLLPPGPITNGDVRLSSAATLRTAQLSSCVQTVSSAPVYKT